MSGSTNHLTQIEVSQSSKEATANANAAAMSPAALFGINADTTEGLNFGLYGGMVDVAGTPTWVGNQVVALSASATNYISHIDGAVSKVTVSPAGWPGPLAGGAVALYDVVTNADQATSWNDYRVSAPGGGGGGGSGSTAAADITIADAGTYFTGTDVEAALQELGADVAVLSATSDADTDQVFTSDTGSTADADPGNGLFTWNHATQASATALYVDNQTAAGVSMATFFASLPPDGYIHLAQEDDATKWQLWKWSVAPTAGAGYYKFTGLTLMASGGSIADAKSVAVSFKGTQPSSVSAYLDRLASVAQGDILYRNATEWVRLAAGTAGQVLQTQGAGANPQWTSLIHDIPTFYPGVLGASSLLYRGKLARAVTFPANFAGSYFDASANATASTVFDVQKNGSSIGTVTIGAGTTTATFATSGGVAISFAAGDRLTVVAPASPDATLADAAITFAVTRG